jgi:hypothetical protein
MTREKKTQPAGAKSIDAGALARRQKRERARNYVDGVWQNLNALKEPPKVKHRSYFEAVENADKKKKLEYKVLQENHLHFIMGSANQATGHY